MAGAFAQGFKLGSDIYDDADRSKRLREDLKMRQEKHTREMQESDLRIAESQRTARKNQQIDTAEEDLGTYINGGTRLGANMPQQDSDPTGFSHEAARVEPYDAASPEGQLGLNRRMMGVASLKGDMNAVSQLQQQQATIARNQALGTGIKEWYSLNPQQKSQLLASGINGTIGTPGQRYLSVQTAPVPGPDGRMGYPAMVIDPATGQAVQQFIREDQAAQVYAALKMMGQDPTFALQHIATVNQNVAAALDAHNKEELEVYKARVTGAHSRNQDVVGAENAQSNRISAEASRTAAGAAATRAKHETQSAGSKMDDQVNVLIKQYQQAYPEKSPQEIRQMALQAVTKDPDRKDPSDVGLAEAGLFRAGGKLYERGKDGKPALVQLPGEGRLDKLIEQRLRERANGGRAAPAPAPASEIASQPGFSQMTAPAGIQPFRTNADYIREAERRQNR